MSAGADLTRWNRGGLSRFRYVDGNAATFLEDLRLSLASRATLERWQQVMASVPADESLADRLERLELQLVGERADPAWEIVRSLARSAHLIAEALDAYANEGFLGTATQWDDVRRLVEMLDYHPAPPASASTPLSIEAKGSGTVARGLQVQYAPSDGSAPITFESLADLAVDPALNGLRLSGWDRSTLMFEQVAGTTLHWTTDEDVSAGAIGLAVFDGSPSDLESVVKVASVDASTGALAIKRVDEKQPSWGTWARADTRLLLGADDIRNARLNGDQVVAFGDAHGLVATDVVAWKDGGDWTFANVEAADAFGAGLSVAPPKAGTKIYRAAAIARVSGDLAGPAAFKAVGHWTGTAFSELSKTAFDVVSSTEGEYRVLKSEHDAVDEIHLVGGSASPAGTAVATTAGEFVFDGGPGDLKSGDPVVLRQGATYVGARVESVVEGDGSFTVRFVGDPVEAVGEMHGPFTIELRPNGHDRSETELTGTALVLDLSDVSNLALPALLAKGRALILEQENAARDGFEAPRAVTVASVDAASGTIHLTDSLGAKDGFTVGNTVVRGNVVEGGHGEARPAKVLGSGDATQSNQSFELAVEDVSFVADATQPSGVRADLAIELEGRTWAQVGSLRDSGPTDSAYEVRMTEDGHLEIRFGDGENGRRLPTGTNIVRATYRVGTGADGNVAAASLSKLVKPHHLVEAVDQPFDAAGGNDMEGTESLRENAPATVLTMERAVSLEDFGRLAASQSSIWQARAFRLPTAHERAESVEVVVVPAGGTALGPLKKTLKEYLVAHALPGVDVTITKYESVKFSLDVTARVVMAEVDAAAVAEALHAALTAAFSLENSRLGDSLYLSAIYGIVEEITGVENSVCVLDGDASLRRITGSSRSVIHLVSTDLTIQILEFAL